MKCHPCNAPSPQQCFLVSNLDQVIRQLLNHICCISRLNGFWVVCDEECLCCFNDYDAFSPLRPMSVLIHVQCRETVSKTTQGIHAYLLPIQAPLVRFQCDKPLACNVNARALYLLHTICVALILKSCYHLFELIGCHLHVLCQY